MKLLLTCLFFIVLFSAFLSPVHAQTCTLTIQPKQSIQESVDQLQPGQTLCLAGGTYNIRGTTEITKSNFTIQAKAGETPVLDGGKSWPQDSNGNTPFAAPIYINDADNVTIKNLRIQNFRGRGISVDKTKGLRLIDNTIDWTGRQGISFTESSDGLVEGNTVNNSIAIDWNGAALQIKQSQNIVVKNNTISNSGRDGLISTINKNITFDNNRVFNTKISALYIERADTMSINGNAIFNTDDQDFTGTMLTIKDEWCATCGHDNDGLNYSTQNLTITNNLVLVNDNSRYALNLGLGSVRNGDYIEGAGFKNIKIANNTFIGGYNAVVKMFDHPQTPLRTHTQSYFINNILIKGTGDMFDVASAKTIAKMDFHHNIYSENPGDLINSKGDNNFIGNPQLINSNPSTETIKDFDPKQYQLSSSSPAINAGTNEYVSNPIDYFGTTRPVGSAPDIGFHELTGALLPEWDLNGDNKVDIFDFPSFLYFFDFSNFGFPDLTTFISNLYSQY